MVNQGEPDKLSGQEVLVDRSWICKLLANNEKSAPVCLLLIGLPLSTLSGAVLALMVSPLSPGTAASVAPDRALALHITNFYCTHPHHVN